MTAKTVNAEKTDAVKPAAKPVRAKSEKKVMVLVQRGVQVAVPVLEGLGKKPEPGAVVHVSEAVKIVDDGSKRLRNPHHAVFKEFPASEVVTKLNAVCIADATDDALQKWHVIVPGESNLD